MNKKRLIASLLALSLGLMALVGCNSEDQSTIKVGSKNFSEGMLVSEIYSLALEDNGYEVERNFGLSSPIIHDALMSDEIDMYPEYTGTALLTILKLPKMTDPEEVYETVKEEYKEQFNLTVLDYTDINNSQGLMIRTDRGEEYDIENISQLQEKAEHLRFASNGEFDEREDGLAGLEEHYGPFDFKDHKVYEASLKYQVLDNDEADVSLCYTTEGQLTQEDKYRLLEDDKDFWPPYNLVPIIDTEVLEANPGLEDIINEVSSKLDSETIIELNAQVDIEGRPYEEVAKEFYQTIK